MFPGGHDGSIRESGKEENRMEDELALGQSESGENIISVNIALVYCNDSVNTSDKGKFE